MSKNANGEYEVGRGKPPKQHQFKKGQSGNPRGRPKVSASVYTHLEEELKRKVTIHENGRPITLTMHQLMAKSMVSRAIKGDAKAIALIDKMREQAANPLYTKEDWVITMKFDHEEELAQQNAEDAAKWRHYQLEQDPGYRKSSGK
jgi:hypothetical protein